VDQVEAQVRQMRQLSVQVAKGLVDRLSSESSTLRTRLVQVESELLRARSLLRDLEAAGAAPQAPTPVASLPPKPEASRAPDEARQAVAWSLRGLAGQASSLGVGQEERRAFLSALARQFYARVVATSPGGLNEAEERDLENLVDLILRESDETPPEVPPPPPTS
jgi:hypothetical protein